MALKTVLESLDGVDDDLKGHYRSVDGKFVLDVEDVDAHPKVRNLKSALEAQKAANTELRTKNAVLEDRVKEIPEDFDAARWHELSAATADDKRKKDKAVEDIEKMYQARLQALESKHANEIQARDAENEKLNRKLDQLALDTELTDLLVKAGVNEKLLKAAKLTIGQSVQTIADESGNRSNVVETTYGPQKLSEFLPTWAETEGAPFMAKATGPEATGSNGAHRGDVNPWAKDTMNLTRQGAVVREDPAKARRFMTAAGLNDAQISQRLGA